MSREPRARVESERQTDLGLSTDPPPASSTDLDHAEQLQAQRRTVRLIDAACARGESLPGEIVQIVAL